MFLRFKWNQSLKGWSSYAIAWSDLELEPVPLGRGSYGVVYRGRYRNTDVAVKKFLMQDQFSEVMKDFKAEVRILGSLRHPNIILFMGACFEKAHLAIVTEYMPNGTLHSVLHNAELRFEWSLRMRMLRDICCGMAYLHANNPPILHRDLKSPNILVDSDFRLKVADFGLTIFKDRKEKKKETKKELDGTDEVTFQGSLYWAAPEVMQNLPYTEKCDVYSFGIIAWEVITREQLYAGLHPLSVGYKVMVENMRPNIPEECPETLSQIMQSCWAADPDKRPSFSELLNTFEGLASPYLSNFINNLKEFRMLNQKEAELQKDFSTFLDEISPEIHPPQGEVVLVVTDVEKWTALWDQYPSAMVDAVRNYHMTLRRAMRECQGFEASLDGRAGLVAFPDVLSACKFTLNAQIYLAEVPWPKQILESNECPVVVSSQGQVLFRGLRVRMAIHVGKPSMSLNPLTKRPTYHGPDVNFASQLCATAHGGQILISSAALRELPLDKLKDYDAKTSYVGEILNNKANEQVVQLVCARLAERTFQPGSNQSSELDVFDRFLDSHRWLIRSEDLTLDPKPIGKSRSGEVYPGMWKGMHVVVKRLDTRNIRTGFPPPEKASGPGLGMGVRRSSARPTAPVGGHTALVALSTELSLLFSLRHPNLVLYIGAGADSSGIFLVTELLERGDLVTLCKDPATRPQLSVRISMIRDVVNAFNYLHSFKPPIIHGSFKTFNILVGSAWQVKISGYGMSRIYNESETYTLVDHWAAPEIFRGEPATTAADVYAFGICMWEAITCQFAFHDAIKDISWVRAVIQGERPPLPNDPEVPQWYLEILQACWQSNPHDRPDFATISAAFVSELGSTAGSSSTIHLRELAHRPSISMFMKPAALTKDDIASLKAGDSLVHEPSNSSIRSSFTMDRDSSKNSSTLPSPKPSPTSASALLQPSSSGPLVSVSALALPSLAIGESSSSALTSDKDEGFSLTVPTLSGPPSSALSPPPTPKDQKDLHSAKRGSLSSDTASLSSSSSFSLAPPAPATANGSNSNQLSKEERKRLIKQQRESVKKQQTETESPSAQ